MLLPSSRSRINSRDEHQLLHVMTSLQAAQDGRKHLVTPPSTACHLFTIVSMKTARGSLLQIYGGRRQAIVEGCDWSSPRSFSLPSWLQPVGFCLATTCPCLPLAVAPFHNTSCPTTPSAALCWVRSDPDSFPPQLSPPALLFTPCLPFMSFHPYTLSREPPRPAASSLHSSLLRPFLLLCSGSSTSLHSVSLREPAIFLFVPASPVSSSLLHCDCEHSRRWSLSEAELHRLRCSCGGGVGEQLQPKGAAEDNQTRYHPI